MTDNEIKCTAEPTLLCTLTNRKIGTGTDFYEPMAAAEP